MCKRDEKRRRRRQQIRQRREGDGGKVRKDDDRNVFMMMMEKAKVMVTTKEMKGKVKRKTNNIGEKRTRKVYENKERKGKVPRREQMLDGCIDNYILYFKGKGKPGHREGDRVDSVDTKEIGEARRQRSGLGTISGPRTTRD